jgi:cobalt/nickel transport system permease protein
MLWWAITLVIIALSLYWLRSVRKMDNRLIIVAAFCTAALFAIFLVDIPIAGGVHLTMTPLVGILAGPSAGALIVFIVNILAAAVGHGGWSMIGANTLVNFTEVVVAWSLFFLLGKIFSHPFLRAAITTFISLACGTAVMVGVILVSGVQGVTQGPDQVLAGLTIIVVVNLVVAVIESVITGFMVVYLNKVRPDILGKLDERLIKNR